MTKEKQTEQEDQFADIREEARRNAERDAANRRVGELGRSEDEVQDDKKPTELPNDGK